MAYTVMAFDTLGYPEDHPDLVIAKRAVRKLVTDKGDFAYLQPCLSPIWDTTLACHALMEAGVSGSRARGPPGARLGRRAPGAGYRGGLGQRPAACAARRLGLRVPQRPLPRRRRHRGDPVRAAPRRSKALSRRHRPRRRMDARPAKPERWLGLVRRRQYPPLPQQHPVCRSRRAARSADRGPDRPLHQRLEPARLSARAPGAGPGARLPEARAGGRTARGSAAGAPTTSTAPGRCCAR